MEYLTDEDFQTAQQNGISKTTAYQRFYEYGWTREDTVTKPVNSHLLVSAEYKKKCAEVGLSYSTFTKRVKRGMKPEMALALSSKPKLSQEHIAIAEENGISLNTLKKRFYNYRWPIERAITEPINVQYRRKS